jgi:ComF family protein
MWPAAAGHAAAASLPRLSVRTARLRGARAVPELGRPLGRLIADRGLSRAEVVTPVPLHPRRLRARGFNQAALLALGASAAGPRLAHLLVRVRDTPPQTGLGREARRRNVRGAFALARRAEVRGLRVTLVDDVLTTGATAEACAEVLLAGGAKTVEVLTVARVVP